jgi:hypothetical protein
VNEFNWPDGAISYTANNIDGTSIDVTFTWTGETGTFGVLNGAQTPNVGTTLSGGTPAVEVVTNGFSSAGATLTMTLNPPIPGKIGYEIYHMNRTAAGYEGDQYTISARTTSGKIIYPTFTANGSPSWVQTAPGVVDARASSTSGQNDQVGVNFSSDEYIASISMVWNDCSTCGRNLYHGAAFGSFDFCLDDWDKDGVANVFDLDDDNDGILDTLECGVATNTISGGNGGSTTNFTVNSAIAAHFDFDYIDNAVSISINGNPLKSNNILQLEGSPASGETFLEFSSDASTMNSPWLTNSNGLPRLRLVVNETGTILVYGTRSTSSTVMELMRSRDGTSFNKITFLGGSNSFSVVNPNGLGTDAIEGTVFVFSDCDEDGDGIPNYFDTDADGDKCPDALEGGANFSKTDISASDNLADANKGSVDENGVPTNSGIPQGLGSSLDASGLAAECDSCDVANDFDGDGVGDLCDLDDDNDGILDTEESEELGCVTGEPGADFYAIVHDGIGSDALYARHTVSGSWTAANNDFGIFQEGNGFAVDNGSFYYLFHDGNGTDALYIKEGISSSWELLVSDFGISQERSGFAVDNGIFYYLFNDGAGSAALYKKESLEGSWSLLTSNCGIFGTENGFAANNGTFYHLYNDGAGTAALYSSSLSGVTSGTWTLVTSESGLSNANNGFAYGSCFGDRDTDGDGIIDALDLDSDNDGLLDRVEAQTTLTYNNLSNNDANRDGVDAAFDPNEGGTAIVLSDKDADGIPDYLDADSDGDGLADWIEGFDDDNDGDALHDLIARAESFELNKNLFYYVNTDDSDNDGIPNWLEDEDMDGVPNFLDPDNALFKDSDKDGLVDLFDPDSGGEQSLTPDSDGDGEYDFRDEDNQITLPISLLFFKVEEYMGKVRLSWVSATEINNDYYIVERSIDGKLFEEILRVEGAGNSSEELYYQGYDIVPVSGYNYYRLKQVDFDGKIEKFNVKVVYIQEKIEKVRIYPNPTRGHELNIELLQPKYREYLLEIIDVKGKSFHEEIIRINADNPFFRKQVINEFSLNKGVYFIKVKSEGGVGVYRFVVVE